MSKYGPHVPPNRRRPIAGSRASTAASRRCCKVITSNPVSTLSKQSCATSCFTISSYPSRCSAAGHPCTPRKIGTKSNLSCSRKFPTSSRDVTLELTTCSQRKSSYGFSISKTNKDRAGCAAECVQEWRQHKPWRKWWNRQSQFQGSSHHGRHPGDGSILVQTDRVV